jgi:hypothetical protein
LFGGNVLIASDTNQIKLGALSDVGLLRNSAGVLSITDGGAGYGNLVVGNGSAGAPSISFAAGNGFHSVGGSYLVLDSNGFTPMAFAGSPAEILMDATVALNWASANLGTVIDTGIVRSSAGVLKVTDGSTGYGKLAMGGLDLDRTITPTGTTGNQTINKPSGTVNIAASGTSVTVTNSLVTADSIVYAVLRTNDDTAWIKNVVPAAGSFTINLGAAATAEVSIGFLVTN